MGGDIIVKADDESSSDPEFTRSLPRCSCCFCGDSEEFDTKSWVEFSSFEADRRKREKVYKEVFESYDQLQERLNSLNAARLNLLSYNPGAWGGRTNGVKLSDCDVPETTTILLIGPKGSGKSSLINRIIRVMENDKFAPDRAQVSYGSSSCEEGTLFLQEYMIPRASPSFCLYDSRGLCQNSSDNISMIEQWITKGVRHRQPVVWISDSLSVKEKLNLKAHGIDNETRKVNFVIFVVNVMDVMKVMESEEESYGQMISTAFNSPFLSFEDDKAVVVMTHGDLVSLEERVRARVFLGDLLGIPPNKQIFDIPEVSDAATELKICDLLRHSLEHADKNLHCLPLKNSNNFKARGVIQWTIITSFMILLAIAVVMGHVHNKPNYLMGHVHKPNSMMGHVHKPNSMMGHESKSTSWKGNARKPHAQMGHVSKPKSRKVHARKRDEPKLDWGKVRHLWLDDE